jgi:hypothetical protein
MISAQLSPLPQSKQDEIKLMLRSEPFVLLRRVIASHLALKQADAMRFCFKKGSAPGTMTANSQSEIIEAQRMQACLDVLDELSGPDYKYHTVELKIQ